MFKLLFPKFLLNTLLLSLLFNISFSLLCENNLLYAESGSMDSEGASQDSVAYDPFEGFNRGVFSFNEGADQYVLEPISQAYGYITPSFMQRGVTNFFENLTYPRNFLSSLIQLKFDQVWNQSVRFLINSTVGVAGFMDLATDWGYPAHREDIAGLMQYYDVPAGPYLVIPFLGPSNIRDFIGRIADGFLTPIYWLDSFGVKDSEANTIAISLTALDIVNTRYELTDAINAAKESSLDYYSFLQSSYYQIRDGIVYDKKQVRGNESKSAETNLEDNWWDDEDWNDED